jgi:hypothetical protein
VHHTLLFSLLFHKYQGAGAAVTENETNSPIVTNIMLFIIVSAISQLNCIEKFKARVTLVKL